MKTHLLNKTVKLLTLGLFLITFVACSGGEQKDSKTAQNKKAAQKQETPVNPTANRTADGKLNINTATAEALRTIPTVGDKMVHEFEEYRPYTSIRQFRKEIGKYVDEAKVGAYEQYVYVPVHRNDSDAETLMQIPGLEKNEAIKLMDGRPYETDEAFFKALGSYIDEEEMTVAKDLMNTG